MKSTFIASLFAAAVLAAPSQPLPVRDVADPIGNLGEMLGGMLSNAAADPGVVDAPAVPGVSGGTPTVPPAVPAAGGATAAIPAAGSATSTVPDVGRLVGDLSEVIGGILMGSGGN